MPKKKLRNKDRSSCGIYFFFLGFAGMGTLFLYLMFIRPLIDIYNAKDWYKTRGVITRSEVTAKYDGESTVYKIDIHFTYQFKGKQYTSKKYNFDESSNSFDSGKNKIVAKHPVGKAVVCYVNPRKPDEAVIDRGLFANLWFTLVLSPFLLIGYGGLIYLFVKGLKKKGPEPIRDHQAKTNSRPTTNALAYPKLDFQNKPVLKEGSRLAAFISVLIFTLIWDGVILMVVYKEYNFDFTRLGILYLFIIVGLLLIFLCLYLFLQLFNPELMIVLNNPDIKIGENFKFRLDYKGNIDKWKHVKIELVGSITHLVARNNKSSKAIPKNFYKKTIVDSDSFFSILNNQFTVEIPNDTMHSFESFYTKVQWHLIFHGEVENYPDVNAYYKIMVAP